MNAPGPGGPPEGPGPDLPDEHAAREAAWLLAALRADAPPPAGPGVNVARAITAGERRLRARRVAVPAAAAAALATLTAGLAALLPALTDTPT
ncbi:hypothetical protein RM780_03485, partial [Streptomyces sp. DSM 44917]|nr:hypothetical protein [Streptomyces sp. DSM 44917]